MRKEEETGKGGGEGGQGGWEGRRDRWEGRWRWESERKGDREGRERD